MFETKWFFSGEFVNFFHDWKPNNNFFYAGDFFSGRILPLGFCFFFSQKKNIENFFCEDIFFFDWMKQGEKKCLSFILLSQVSLKKQKWTDKYTQRAHQSLFFVFVKTELLIISLWCFRMLKEPTKYFLGEIKFILNVFNPSWILKPVIHVRFFFIFKPPC